MAPNVNNRVLKYQIASKSDFVPFSLSDFDSYNNNNTAPYYVKKKNKDGISHFKVVFYKILTENSQNKPYTMSRMVLSSVVKHSFLTKSIKQVKSVDIVWK